MTERAARVLWCVFALAAGAAALVAASQWTDALVTGRPVLYGEGPVAHAAILFRDGTPYRDASGAVAANYPPLYLALASLGDPFRIGRALTIASALAVAALLWWRARDARPIARAGIALGWLALVPVAIWGAAVKPDMLAVALTAFGVAALERASERGSTRTGVLAGALLAAGVWAKPTAALPLVAVLAWGALRSRGAFRPASAGALAVAAVAVAHALVLGAGDVWRHVVEWNALAWHADQAALVLVLGAATLGIVIVAAGLAGAFRGVAAAYLVGAFGVALLGGREGATINYLLDLAAATSFALATVGVGIARAGAIPLAATVQLALAVALLAPFGVVPGREPTTGAWGPRERLQAVRELPLDQAAGRPPDAPQLVEDSGLLIAAGREPPIDDLFLWSSLARLGRIDPAPLVERVRRGEIAFVVSEADLSRLDAAPAYERSRWHPALVDAVLERYVLDRATGTLWIYRPR